MSKSVYPEDFDAEERRRLRREILAARRQREAAKRRRESLEKKHAALRAKMKKEMGDAEDAVDRANEEVWFFIRNYGADLYSHITKARDL